MKLHLYIIASLAILVLIIMNSRLQGITVKSMTLRYPFFSQKCKVLNYYAHSYGDNNIYYFLTFCHCAL